MTLPSRVKTSGKGQSDAIYLERGETSTAMTTSLYLSELFPALTSVSDLDLVLRTEASTTKDL